MEREVKLKLGWFNIFNLGGALYGWHSTHTWEGVAWGFGVWTILPPLFLFCCFAGALVACKLVDNWPMPKVRVAEQVRIETDEQRWMREYAEHCKATNVPNELAQTYREISAAPIRQESDFDNTASSSSDTSSAYYYTSGGGPG